MTIFRVRSQVDTATDNSILLCHGNSISIECVSRFLCAFYYFCLPHMTVDVLSINTAVLFNELFYGHISVLHMDHWINNISCYQNFLDRFFIKIFLLRSKAKTFFNQKIMYVKISQTTVLWLSAANNNDGHLLCLYLVSILVLVEHNLPESYKNVSIFETLNCNHFSSNWPYCDDVNKSKVHYTNSDLLKQSCHL